MRSIKMLGMAVAATAMLAVQPTHPVHTAGSVEVLHWWTSGGEAAALSVLKEMLQKQGITWKDAPVAGDGGDAAMTTLRARVTADSAPDSSQMLGFAIQDWAHLGMPV